MINYKKVVLFAVAICCTFMGGIFTLFGLIILCAMVFDFICGIIMTVGKAGSSVGEKLKKDMNEGKTILFKKKAS